MTPIHFADLRAYKREALAGFERFLHGDGLPDWPREVFIEVGNLCDLQCAMCGTFSAVNPLKYMLMSEVDRDFSRTGVVCISFSGATWQDYENLRIGGEFDTVLDGIRRLHATKQAQGAYCPIQIDSLTCPPRYARNSPCRVDLCWNDLL